MTHACFSFCGKQSLILRGNATFTRLKDTLFQQILLKNRNFFRKLTYSRVLYYSWATKNIILFIFFKNVRLIYLFLSNKRHLWLLEISFNTLSLNVRCLLSVLGHILVFSRILTPFSIAYSTPGCHTSHFLIT